MGLAIVACGDERSGFGEVEQGDFVVSPQSISYPQVTIGDSAVRTLELRNEGESTIILENLELSDSATRDSSAFHLVNGWRGSLSIEGGESYLLEIRYTPEESIHYGGLLTFSTNIPGERDVEVGIIAQRPQPELFAADTVTFSRTPAGSQDWRLLEVQNLGHADLEIDDISISGDFEFGMSFAVPVEGGSGESPVAPIEHDHDTPPEAIAPGDSAYVRVLFHAVTAEYRSAIINIDSNDPTRPSYPVVVSANSNAPCLELESEEINFGLAPIAHASQRSVTVRNCSDVADTVISEIEFSDDAEGLFAIMQSSLPGQLAEGGTAILGPQQTANFVLTYTPIAEQNDEGMLIITSNDAANTNRQVVVRGQGTELACPIAIAEGRLAGTTRWEDEHIPALPLDIIQFTASQSYDPDETALSYQWTILDSPRGSGAHFQPNPSVENPQMMLDIAGRYEIELTVYDGHGIASCEPGTLIIEAMPDADIHVELTWNVPASQSGTGTDLDLHYLHPAGSWNSGSPWEILYNNRSEDWGADGTVSLDIDDLTGDRPENVNHDNPGVGLTYSAGVYYFSDQQGWGGTDATIRVYLAGQLVREKTRRMETAGGFDGTGDFWHAVDIPWDGLHLEVTDVDVLHSGFPN